MDATRSLVVVADDFGIGPETTRGILELAARGVVTGSVLLVNSPHAEEAVRIWRASAIPLDLGWHPNLTLDEPVAGPAAVPSLVASDGFFHSLPALLVRLALGLVRPAEIERELRAQLNLYQDLVGAPPTLVNAHQHVALFPPIGSILIDILREMQPRPYVRRVSEPWQALGQVAGMRPKRFLLSSLGRNQAIHLRRAGLPGNDCLAGAMDAAGSSDPAFFAHWLSLCPGRVVELMCHPGHPDQTLWGRDCVEGDGLVERRAEELHMLSSPQFVEECQHAGLTFRSPSSLLGTSSSRGLLHAA